MDAREVLHEFMQLMARQFDVYASKKLRDPNFSNNKEELEKKRAQIKNLKNQEDARYKMYKKTGKI